MQLFFRLHREVKPNSRDLYSSLQEIQIHVHPHPIGVTIGVDMEDTNAPLIPSFFKSVSYEMGEFGSAIVENVYSRHTRRNRESEFVPFKTRRHRVEQRSQSFLIPYGLNYIHSFTGMTYSHPVDGLLTVVQQKIPPSFGWRELKKAEQASVEYYQKAPSHQWLVPETHHPPGVAAQLVKVAEDIANPRKMSMDIVNDMIPRGQPVDGTLSRFSTLGALPINFFTDRLQTAAFDTVIPPPIIPRSPNVVYGSGVIHDMIAHYMMDSVPPDFDIGYIKTTGKPPQRADVRYVYDRFAPLLGEGLFDRSENLFLVDNIATAAVRWFATYLTICLGENSPEVDENLNNNYTIYIRRSFNEEACIDFLRPDGRPIVSLYLDLALQSMVSVGVSPLDYNS